MSELDMMVYSILRRNLKSDCIGIHHKIGTINIGIKNTKEMSTGRGSFFIVPKDWKNDFNGVFSLSIRVLWYNRCHRIKTFSFLFVLQQITTRYYTCTM